MPGSKSFPRWNLELKLQKGLLLFNQKTKLDDGSIRPKFFVLMEELRPRCKSLLIFMTTSKKIAALKRRKNRGVLIEEPLLNRPKVLVLLRKYLDVSVEELNKSYRKRALLSQSQIEIVEKAVKTAKFLSNEIKRRIFYKQQVKPKVVATYKPFNKEEAKFIKKKLGIK